MTKRLANPLFRIGDLMRLLNEPRHVIHHWENEFRTYLRVYRSKGGQRWYTAEQVDLFGEIQRLMHVELYTTAGAKRQLRLASERERQAG